MQAAKRPGGIRVTIDDGMRSVPPIDCELLMLDSVLQELAVIDQRQARIVEMKYFGGLSEEEVAAILSLSRTTVTREWQSARAWLYPPPDRRAHGASMSDVNRQWPRVKEIFDEALPRPRRSARGVRARRVRRRRRARR